MMTSVGVEDKAIVLGHPSYIWREGQERRLQLVRQYVSLEGARILDVGCGLGLYVQRFRDFGGEVHGVDVDADKVREASLTLPHIQQASAENLPYPDNAFDMVFSHEVLEHVPDDRQAVHESYRVLKPGGRLVIFVPNRGYPFETHGIYWRGVYHFGNIPLVNYLPDRWRSQLCPHVRVYTHKGLERLLLGLAGRIIAWRCLFAGYDSIVARRPTWGRLLRQTTYALERTPLQILGLSHFMVYQKAHT